MSNGYLVAASVDLATLDEIAQGFGLDIIAAHAITDREAVGAALAGAPNIGIVLSVPGAREDAFVALLQVLAARLKSAQLILVEPDALRAFAFLPALWPTMSIEEARERAATLLRSREPPPAVQEEPPPPAEPAPDALTPPPLLEPAEQAETPSPEPEVLPGSPPERAPHQPAEPEIQDIEAVEEALSNSDQADEPETASEPVGAESYGDTTDEEASPAEPEPQAHSGDEVVARPLDETQANSVDAEAPAPAPEPPEPPAPSALEPSDPPAPLAAGAPAPVETLEQAEADGPHAPPPARKREPARAEEDVTIADRAAPRGSSANLTTAPADASAFAPRKLRRGESELVRIAIHQPKDLKAVIKAAKKADPSTDAAPHSMSVGDLALDVSVGVALEVKGGECDGEIQRRVWKGDPLDFSFAVTPSADVRQVIVLGRVFVDDAQIGVLAFKRDVVGPKTKATSDGERVKLKRHNRVFLSYSSKDREAVSAIATAYAAAGIEHFWDRASLKSGEEWGPRLRREIDRCDLFHLCWSKSAASSEWVEKETSHAIALRRNKKRPDITVQMLDGPPWAKHPDSLDSINFDDFVRAAIVGYARGDSET